jgi:hypothetical protein
LKRGSSTFHHRIPDITRNIGADCSSVASSTSGNTMRGWKYSPEKCMLQASAGSSGKPCWRMKFRTARLFMNHDYTSDRRLKTACGCRAAT